MFNILKESSIKIFFKIILLELLELRASCWYTVVSKPLLI